MRIAVIGSNVLAWIYAGKLRRVGWEVYLVDSCAEKLDVIKRKGLIVCEDQESDPLDVHCNESIEELPEVDVALIFCSHRDNPQLAAKLQGVMKQQGWIVSLQRGLADLDCFGEVVGADYVLRGLSHFQGKATGAGEVLLTAYGQTLLTSLSGEKAQDIDKLLRLFNSASLNALYLDKMDDLIWEKLIVSAAIEPLSAILRVPNGALLQSTYAMALISEVVHEALNVAKKKGVCIKRHNLTDHILRIIKLTSNQSSNMYQDIRDKRNTDIDALNGAIVKQGESCQVSTPVNALITAFVHSIEECTIN